MRLVMRLPFLPVAPLGPDLTKIGSILTPSELADLIAFLQTAR